MGNQKESLQRNSKKKALNIFLSNKKNQYQFNGVSKIRKHQNLENRWR
jgi:hypothetical protein